MAEVPPLADGEQSDDHPALSAGPSADDEQLDRVTQAAALGEPPPERIGESQEAIEEGKEPAPEGPGHQSTTGAGVRPWRRRWGFDAGPPASASRPLRQRPAQGVTFEAGHGGRLGQSAQLHPSHRW